MSRILETWPDQILALKRCKACMPRLTRSELMERMTRARERKCPTQ
jgi:hypothetical protein